MKNKTIVEDDSSGKERTTNRERRELLHRVLASRYYARGVRAVGSSYSELWFAGGLPG